MWASILITVISVGPRAPADADWAAYLPKLSGGATYAPFFSRAGERSVLLRPASWREDFHPLLSIDLTRPEEMSRAGLDLNGSATVSEKEDYRYTCVQLADVDRYEKKCLERLVSLGSQFRELKDGVIRAGARDSIGRVLAGYVLKGKESCAIRGHGRSVESKFEEAAKLLGKNSTALPFKLADGLPGAAQLVSKLGVMTLRGGDLSLAVEGKGKGLATVGLLGAGPSPFAGAAPDGLTVVKLRGDRSQLGNATDAVIRTLMQVCMACDRSMLDEVVRGLLPQLGGNAMAFAREVQVKGSLRTMANRYFALKNALLSDVLDPKAAREALAPLAKVPGVKTLPSGEGFAVSMNEGEIRFGVRGRFLYLSNDERALDVAVKSAARADGTQAHGLDLRIDPRRLARALGQVPLLDALTSKDLVSLVLVAGELGPLLLTSERIGGWLDPTGPDSARGHLEWILAPAEAKPSLDGGFALDGGGMLDAGFAFDAGEALDAGGEASDAGARRDGGL